MSKINRMRIVFLIVAVVAFVLMGRSGRQYETIAPALSEAQTAAAMDRVLDRAMDRYSLAGVAAGAMRGGEFYWSARRGIAQADGTAITGETAFNLGSISKPIVVWTVLAMAQAGEIDLDAPVGRYLTRFDLPTGEHDPDAVTIRRLLRHTAGTNNQGYGGYDRHEEQPGDIIELSESFAPLRVAIEPGERRVYSGGGYVLLQMMIEDVTGRSLDEIARERVFAPLGMTDSAFDSDALAIRSDAFNYYRQPIEDLRNVAQAAAGGYASGDDIERFIQAHLDGGSVLSAASLAAALAPTEPAEHFAMSYTRSSTSNGFLYGHGGNNSTWHGQIYVRPETGDGFYFLANSTSGAQLDLDLSCAWLSHLRGRPAEEICADQADLTQNLDLATVIIIQFVVLSAYWLMAGWATDRRQLSLKPSGRGPLRLSGRLFMAVVLALLLVFAIWVFYTNSVIWRTETVMIDEIPLDELERLMPAILALIGMLTVNFWSSPVR
jgi:CubicO group peptidase (beta-lactamase class C family)